METNSIEFTPTKLHRLKVLYGRAKANGEESFMFDGHELLVAYAKYLIEYLEMKFSGKEVG